jgi:hypothetical protein
MAEHITLTAIADHILEVKQLDSTSLQHLEACSYCQSDFQWLKDLRSAGKRNPTEAATSDAA